MTFFPFSFLFSLVIFLILYYIKKLVEFFSPKILLGGPYGRQKEKKLFV